MKVLVTGGCGFIGSHIVEHHMSKGDEVFVVDDVTTGNRQNVAHYQHNPKFELEEADILTWENLDERVKWADRIYHMAAVVGVYQVLSKPFKVFDSNINGTERLLKSIYETGAKPRLIIASSSSVYGHSDKDLLNEEDNLILAAKAHPLRGYAISKIVDEVVGMAYYNTAQIPLSLIRLFNTIGPRQTGLYGMVVPRFVQQACLNEPLTIYGDGTQIRSFCDVHDTVAMLVRIAENDNTIGQIINVGRDVAISINDLADIIKKRAKSSSSIEYIPYLEAYGQELTDIKQRRPDISKMRGLIHYEHQWPLERTVDLLIDLFQKNRDIDHPRNLPRE